MARAAGDNTISAEKIEAYLDRWTGLDRDAKSIMGKAMKDCKDGPRADQKSLKAEMKDAGVRMKTFQAMLKIREFEEKATAARADLEDDDLDQYREIVLNYPKDTIFGFMARKALNEPALNDDE